LVQWDDGKVSSADAPASFNPLAVNRIILRIDTLNVLFSCQDQTTDTKSNNSDAEQFVGGQWLIKEHHTRDHR
tara:strand:+ start:1396 stop:1614 length:219 start_codon:yes stop_codon:yes gene_type:complete